MDEQPDATLHEEVTEIEEVSEPAEVETVEASEPAPQQKQEVPKKLVAEAKSIGAPIPSRLDKLRTFIVECKRVLRVTKKPDRAEFQTIVKISAAGIGIIGLVGFIVHLAKELLFH